MSGRWRDRLAVAPAVVVVVVLFGGALAGAVRTSLQPLGEPVSLDVWRRLFADPSFTESLWFTLRITVAATALSAVAGLGLALALRGRGGLARTLATLPVPVPHLLVASTAVLWLAPGGLADRLLGGLPLHLVRDEHGLGIVLVYGYKEAPFLALLLLAGLGRGVAEREEAAAACGAGPGQRLRWVVWPAIRAPLALGCLVVAAFVLGAFEVPLLVGPSSPTTLAEHAREATQGDLITGESTAAATLLMTAAAAIALAAGAVRFARGAGT